MKTPTTPVASHRHHITPNSRRRAKHDRNSVGIHPEAELVSFVYF